MPSRKLFSLKTEIKLLTVGLGHIDRNLRAEVLQKARVDDFGSREGAEVRARIETLQSQGGALPPVTDFFEDLGLSLPAREAIRIGAQPAALQQASQYSKDTVRALLDQLHQYRKLRAVMRGAQQAVFAIQNEVTDDTIRLAEQAFSDALSEIRRTENKQVLAFGEGVEPQEAVNEIKKSLNVDQYELIPTGLFGLDAWINGMKRGEMFVISASRGGGKSAVATQMQINQFKAGYKVGVLQLEMDRDQTRDRIWANVAAIDHSKVRDPVKLNAAEREKIRTDVWNFYRDGIENKAKLRIWHVDDPFYKPEQIENDLGPFGFDVIYVDYLTLFSTGGNEIWKAQKEASRYLKQLAKRLRCVVVVLTQLSDDDRVKYGRGPEEDADWWLWWRYGEEQRENGKVEMILDKARHARPCTFPAQFTLNTMKIETSPPDAKPGNAGPGMQDNTADYQRQRMAESGLPDDTIVEFGEAEI